MDGTSKAWLALILRDYSQAFIRPILRRYRINTLTQFCPKMRWFERLII